VLFCEIHKKKFYLTFACFVQRSKIHLLKKCEDESTQKPLTAAARLKAYAVFDCSDIGIVGLNSAPGMDGSALLMCLCCRA